MNTSQKKTRFVWVKLALSLSLVAGTGVGVWAIVTKLDAATFNVLAGILVTLAIVVVVGVLFIGQSLIQAYIRRRVIQQDDLNDMRQQAFMVALMRGQQPKVNVSMPEQRGYPMLGGWSQQGGGWPPLQDTTQVQPIDTQSIGTQSIEME